MNQVEWANSELPNTVAQKLLLSIRHGDSLNPNWITEAIVRAQKNNSTFNDEIWNAVRDLVGYLESPPGKVKTTKAKKAVKAQLSQSSRKKKR